jgi:uncharacterized membrane protein YecN with MAPEG domain
MAGVALVTAFALIEYYVFGILVGMARSRTKIAAPATTGDPEFERYYRVHQNTLEQLVIFIPALWMFADFLSASVATALGILFIVARVIYARGYYTAAEKRGPGFAMTFGINAILIVGAIIGAIMKAR